MENVSTLLISLNDIHDEGLITEAEFADLKGKTIKGGDVNLISEQIEALKDAQRLSQYSLLTESDFLQYKTLILSKKDVSAVKLSRNSLGLLDRVRKDYCATSIISDDDYQRYKDLVLKGRAITEPHKCLREYHILLLLGVLTEDEYKQIKGKVFSNNLGNLTKDYELISDAHNLYKSTALSDDEFNEIKSNILNNKNNAKIFIDSDRLTRLSEYYILLRDNLISGEEYQTIKSRILYSKYSIEPPDRFRDRLIEYKDLVDKKAISEEEYKKMKKDILPKVARIDPKLQEEEKKKKKKIILSVIAVCLVIATGIGVYLVHKYKLPSDPIELFDVTYQAWDSGDTETYRRGATQLGLITEGTNYLTLMLTPDVVDKYIEQHSAGDFVSKMISLYDYDIDDNINNDRILEVIEETLQRQSVTTSTVQDFAGTEGYYSDRPNPETFSTTVTGTFNAPVTMEPYTETKENITTKTYYGDFAIAQEDGWVYHKAVYEWRNHVFYDIPSSWSTSTTTSLEYRGETMGQVEDITVYVLPNNEGSYFIFDDVVHKIGEY